MIWDGAACRHPVGFPRCGSGEHADTIVTYILQAETVTVISLDSYEGYDGAFIELQIPKLALPGMVPYLTNVVSQGMLYQDVLNATRFMDEWVEMSLGLPPGLFANPMRAAANQCFEKYQDESEQDSDTPPNAMIRFDKDVSKAILVDIFDVTATDTEYRLIARMAPLSSEIHVPEGTCHTRQELGSPHYHHVSLCNDIILDYSIDYASNLIWGGGMTAFIKRGSSEGGQGGLLIGDGGDGGP